ncbi:membrane or secreted protein [Robertkochia marina]|uniref:Membrane or secreted protein n=1 Tax=Robertkochia marina TaxID=1227945 RepID=A0A4S3M144_9FLAO|nr:membrane or secreted protein [Robertkochia marina]THD68794.1 membrane or secreted protein [Robertkochia marina]TRZ43868.1 membrane or secreted protein [Robertkochia marina]
MKSFILALSSIFFCSPLFAQSPVGAWEATTVNAHGDDVRIVAIFTENYQSVAYYQADNGNFLRANGGSWRLDGNTMHETVEWDCTIPQRVGNTVSIEIELTEMTLKEKGSEVVFNRIDQGDETKLAGAWLISGRKRDGEIQMRDTDGPRKTMKILSGTRFQWIAYNTETKEFMGTGGGTYTAKGGKYIENIEFFSRDDSRVGASLDFNYELKDGNWHHSGKSSKGVPIYEIWVPRK